MEFDKELKEYGESNGVPITYDVTLEYLINTINKRQSKQILEIGTAIGFGSISMAQLTECKHIDTLEIDSKTFEIANENISKRNLSNKIKTYNIDAKEYIDNCDKKYDLIYLDGPKGQYVNYLPKLLEILTDDGIIVADDVFFHGMVTGTIEVPVSCRAMIKGLHRFVREIITSKALKSKVLNIGNGVAIVEKRH